jgi:hypothetical protein
VHVRLAFIITIAACEQPYAAPIANTVAPSPVAAPSCAPLPARRPDDLVIAVSQSGMYPRVGRQFGSVQLVSHRGTCTSQPCWIVDDAKLDAIYTQLRDRGCERIATHPPPALPTRPMYRDENWLAVTWSGGTCAVEDSDARVVADGDVGKLKECLELIGVIFGSDGRAFGMR